MKSFNKAIDKISINEEMLSPDQALNYVEKTDFDENKGDLKRIKGYDQPELVSGGSIRSELIDVVVHLQKQTGLKFIVTAGNDKFHKNHPTSWHNKGNAIDLVVRPDSRKNIDKVEKALVDMMIGSEFDTEDGYRLAGINEYDKPSGHSTAGHFHISLTPDDISRDGRECIFPRHNISSYKDIRKLRKSGESPKFNPSINNNRPQTSDGISSITKADGVTLYARGSKGQAVSKIQTALIAKGMELPKRGVDGIFGSETRDAVVKYQTKNNLLIDGIVGPQTWKSLFGTEMPGANKSTNIKAPQDARALEIYNGSKFLHTSAENGITYEVTYSKDTGEFTSNPKSKFRRKSKHGGTISRKNGVITWKNTDGKESQIVNKHDFNFFSVLFNKIDEIKESGLTTGGNVTTTNIQPGKKLKPADFMNTYGPSMIKATKGTPLLPSVKLAQAALETGWGKHVIGEANNMFGIKANGSPNEYWDGSSVTSGTAEYYGGKRGTYDKAFRKYKSLEDSIMDHSRLLMTASHYAGVRSAKTAEDQAHALKAGGYATSPDYAQKLINIINTYNFKSLDAQAGKNVA